MIRVNEPAIGKQNCGNRRSVSIRYFDLPGTKTRLWGANSAQRKGAHLHCFYTRLNTLTKNHTPRTYVVNNRVRSEGIRRSLIASAKPHGNIRLDGWIFQAPIAKVDVAQQRTTQAKKQQCSLCRQSQFTRQSRQESERRHMKIQ